MLHPKEISSHVLAIDANCSENSGAPAVIVAAAGLDNVKVTGVTIDRYQNAAGTVGNALAATINLATQWLGALTNTKTLSLAHELQESADGSTWDTAEVIEALTVKQTATSSTNFRGIDEHSIDCRNRKRWIRFNVTLDLSATSADEALFSTTATLGGYDVLPVAEA